MPVNTKKTVLTIVMDNCVRYAGLAAEHGWALLIESGGDRILFDTGAGKNIINNLKQLGYTAGMINKIFISHGHYDHTGGLEYMLRHAGRDVEIFSHPSIFDKKYKLTKSIKRTYIGIPLAMDDYSALGAGFRSARESIEISPGIYSTGEIKQAVPFERPDINFIKKANGLSRHDDLIDDTAVIIEMERGLVLITGCAHRGLVNTLRQAQEISGREHFLAVIGGFHLAGRKKGYIDRTISALKDISLDMIIPAHCSGAEGFFALRQEFGKKCEYGFTGKKIVFKD